MCSFSDRCVHFLTDVYNFRPMCTMFDRCVQFRTDVYTHQLCGPPVQCVYSSSQCVYTRPCVCIHRQTDQKNGVCIPSSAMCILSSAMSILSSAMSILSKKDEYTQVKCASIHGETDQPTFRGTSRNHRIQLLLLNTAHHTHKKK